MADAKRHHILQTLHGTASTPNVITSCKRARCLEDNATLRGNARLENMAPTRRDQARIQAAAVARAAQSRLHAGPQQSRLACSCRHARPDRRLLRRGAASFASLGSATWSALTGRERGYSCSLVRAHLALRRCAAAGVCSGPGL
jgi:hypothetical protein